MTPFPTTTRAPVGMQINEGQLGTNLLVHMGLQTARSRCRADLWEGLSPGCLEFSALEHREPGRTRTSFGSSSWSSGAGFGRQSLMVGFLIRCSLSI
jgi:hypothetical protein